MQRRPLGDSGIEVSLMGLGTWAAGASVETWGHVDDRESVATIQKALDSGINLIDTAPIYGLGHSENIVAEAIRGRRDQVVLATKCGLLFPTSADQPPLLSLNPESIILECEESLRRLKTDVIDLYQCHWPDPSVPIGETMGALSRLREQGKIRAIGLSNFSVEEATAARAFGLVHAMQPPFSLLHLEAAKDILPYCQEHNIAVFPYSPLAKGLLTGKFTAKDRFQDVRASDPEFEGDRYLRNLGVVEALRAIAAGYDKTVAQLVISWTTYYPGVTAPLVGAKRPSQLVENLGGVGWTLAAEDREKIDEILRN